MSKTDLVHICHKSEGMNTSLYAYFLISVSGGCKWIRIPAIVYSSHVATTLVAILADILLNDYSQSSVPAPVTFEERLNLCAVYLPYLVIPVMILLTMLFHPAYSDNSKSKSE